MARKCRDVCACAHAGVCVRACRDCGIVLHMITRFQVMEFHHDQTLLSHTYVLKIVHVLTSFVHVTISLRMRHENSPPPPQKKIYPSD